MSEIPAGRAIRYRLEYACVRLLAGLVGRVGERNARFIARALGRLTSRLWGSRRQMAERNLRRSLPSLPDTEVHAIARQAFESTAIALFEVLRFPRMNHRDVLTTVHCDDPEILRTIADQGRGAILMSGHFGNWELLGAWVRAQGFAVDLVVKPMRNPYVDALFNRCRKSMGVGIIQTQIATRGIVRALQDNRFVAILADQFAGAEGVEVDFFGRPASTPRGPAALALKFGCPIVTGSLERLPTGGYHAHLDPILVPIPHGDPEDAVRRLTQEITTRIENHIRRAPGQWLWTHNRWHD
jgi:KDO2-lipid IV(A) lauroyltransferase